MADKRYDLRGESIQFPLIRSCGFHNFKHSVAIRRHHHDAGPEVTFVLKGSAVWQLERGGEFHQPGGTLAIMPRGVGHQGAGETVAPCGLFWYVLEVGDPETLRANTPFAAAELDRLFAVFTAGPARVASPVDGELAHVVGRLVALLRRENAAAEEGTAAEMRLLLAGIVLETAKALAAPAATLPGGGDLVLRADRFIRARLGEKLAVDDIAAACGLGESQFARRFRRASGVTPADYVQRLRIEAACRRLTATGDSVTAIAFRLGFSSSQYFSAVFRRYVGLPPGVFRRKNRMKNPPRA